MQFRIRNNEKFPSSDFRPSRLIFMFVMLGIELTTSTKDRRIVVPCLGLACRHASALNLLEIFVRKHGCKSGRVEIPKRSCFEAL